MALLWRHDRQDEGGVTSPALVVFPGGNYRNIKDKHVNHSHGAGTLPFNDTRRWRSHLVYEEGGDVAGLLQLACADDHPAQLRSRLRRHDRHSPSHREARIQLRNLQPRGHPSLYIERHTVTTVQV